MSRQAEQEVPSDLLNGWNKVSIKGKDKNPENSKSCFNGSSKWTHTLLGKIKQVQLGQKKGTFLSPQEHCQTIKGSRVGQYAEQSQCASDWTHTKVIRVRQCHLPDVELSYSVQGLLELESRCEATRRCSAAPPRKTGRFGPQRPTHGWWQHHICWSLGPGQTQAWCVVRVRTLRSAPQTQGCRSRRMSFLLKMVKVPPATLC